MTNTVDKIKQAYKEIYDLTNPECGKCRVPRSCCSPEYCDEAKRWAKDQYNIDLVPVDQNSKLPFMGEKGCIVEPYLRPMCSVHLCENRINQSVSFYSKYFKLRDKINELEFQFMEESK